MESKVVVGNKYYLSTAVFPTLFVPDDNNNKLNLYGSYTVELQHRGIYHIHTINKKSLLKIVDELINFVNDYKFN